MYTRAFFNQPTLKVAKALLGAKLSTFVKGVETSGIIVEVEAYHGGIDRASHSYGGPTGRNQVMFMEGGYCYVYLIYGIHHCVNVVTEPSGVGAAVLIRALEPLEGIESMRRRRKSKDIVSLTSGPGKLCQALGIDKRLSGEHFLASNLISLTPYCKVSASNIGASRRIGISKSTELEWRYFIEGNQFVSPLR